MNLPPALPVTEQRNPSTRGLDLYSTRDIVRAMSREDRRVVPAVAREIGAIARAAEAMAAALAAGGRVLYVGAGTSGRLAALDAAEIPPTFGLARRRVEAVIAGGQKALTRAVEGAEDSSLQGARDVVAKRVSAADVVVGISASGSTPYVLGALSRARRAGAVTVGITSNRKSAMAQAVDVLIAPRTGAEVLAGSTRLKAGTAQKMVLNMLSTAAMVRLGRVYDNWMIGVSLTNQKLRRRGARILEQAAGVSVSHAARALRQSGHDARVALIMLKTGASREAARARLEASGGNLRLALSRPAARRTARLRK